MNDDNLIIRGLKNYKKWFSINIYEFILIIIYLGLGLIVGFALIPQGLIADFWKIFIAVGVALVCSITFIPVSGYRLHIWLFRWLKYIVAPKKFHNPTIMPYASVEDDFTIKTSPKYGSGLTTKGNYLVQGIKVGGRDLFLENPSTQQRVLNSLAEFFRSQADLNFSLIKIPEERNSEKAYKSIWENAKKRFPNALKSTDEAFKKSQNDPIFNMWMKKVQFWKDFSSKHSTPKAGFYFFFYGSNLEDLNSKIHFAMEKIENLGVKVDRCEAKNLVEVIQKLVNPYKEISEQDFEANKDQLFELLRPEKIVIKPDSVIIDNCEMAVVGLKIPPRSVPDFWLYGFLSNPNLSAVINFHEYPTETQEKLISNAKISQEIHYGTKKTKADKIKTGDLVEKLDALQTAISLDQEKLVSCTIWAIGHTFDLTQPGFEDLDPKTYAIKRIKNQIAKTIKKMKFQPDNLKYLQETAFFGILPKNFDPLFSLNEINMTSQTAGAMYPFNAVELHDDELPFYMGIDNNGESISLNLFIRNHYRKNSNMIILGKSGSGKSYFLSGLAQDLAIRGNRVIIIDFEKGFIKPVKKLNGNIIDLSSAQSRINPLEVFAVDEYDDSGAITNTTYIDNHVLLVGQFCNILFANMKPDGTIGETISRHQQTILGECLKDLYKIKNINDANLGTKTAKDFPTFNDLYRVVVNKKLGLEYTTALRLKQEGFGEPKEVKEINFEEPRKLNETLRKELNDLNELIRYLGELTTIKWHEMDHKYYVNNGRYSKYFNGITTLKTTSSLTVFDFYNSQSASLDKNWFHAVQMLVLEYIRNEIKKNDQEAVRDISVIIDEAHLMLDEQQPYFLNFLARTYKQIRKKKGNMIIATQSPRDFTSSEERSKQFQSAIANSQYLSIFSLTESDTKDLNEKVFNYGLTDAEMEAIITAKTGEVLLRVHENEKHQLTVQMEPQVIEGIETHAKKSETQNI